MPAGPHRLSARDRRDDLRMLLLTSGVLLIAFAVGSTLQTVFVYRTEHLVLSELTEDSPLLGERLSVNLIAVLVVLLVCAALRLTERPAWLIAAVVFALSVVIAFARHALQVAVGIYDNPLIEVSAVEIVTVGVVIAVSVGIGLAHVKTRARLREKMRAEADHRLRASTALADLATAEMRVRREVADGLHNTLQGRLVLIEARIAALARRAADDPDGSPLHAQLDELRRDLGGIRERDVRDLSHLLYPVGVDIGLEHALRVLIRRVPPEIAVSAEVSPDAERLLDESGGAVVARRIALVRSAEEGITNALRHGAATTIRLTVVVEGTPPRVRLIVEDDGSGPPPAPEWNGLARISERLDLDGGSVSLRTSSLGGARLEVDVPA